MEHVGIVVDDLAAAVEFFLALRLELDGETSVEGEVVDRMTGLEGVRSDLAFLQTPTATASSRWCGTARPRGWRTIRRPRARTPTA